MKLTDLTCGIEATIISLSELSEHTRNQLTVLGLLPKTKITVTRISPFGGALQIQLRGCFIALDFKIAEQIEVEKTEIRK